MSHPTEKTVRYLRVEVHLTTRQNPSDEHIRELAKAAADAMTREWESRSWMRYGDLPGEITIGATEVMP